MITDRKYTPEETRFGMKRYEGICDVCGNYFKYIARSVIFGQIECNKCFLEEVERDFYED